MKCYQQLLQVALEVWVTVGASGHGIKTHHHLKQGIWSATSYTYVYLGLCSLYMHCIVMYMG